MEGRETKNISPNETEAESEKNESEIFNLRYKLSEAEFIFKEKCTPETCIDPYVTSHSIASILNETLSSLKLVEGEDGLRNAAHAFEPSGTSISPELKRQEFMAYLRKSGFIADMAKLLLTLYDMDELPPDDETVEFITKTLGYGLSAKLERPAALAYKEKLKKTMKKYEEERDLLRRVLDNFESSPAQMDSVNPNQLPPLEMLEAEGEDAEEGARFQMTEPMKMADLIKPISPDGVDDFDGGPVTDEFIAPPPVYSLKASQEEVLKLK